MIEFRALGALDLRDAGGREAPGVLAQSKRLALLAYLALARPRGFHRRDALLALFWPERDQAHARHALNQALHFLRRALGPDVILSRGTEEVGLNAALLRCDVHAFEQALEHGQPDEALALFRGDLLEAFHIPAAPEFTHWLESERARLRARAADAARAMYDRCASDGRPADAAHWARRALTLDPFDERSLRHLMRALDQAGKRAAALREYQAFADRLAAELEADPSPETQRLADDVREREELSLHASGNRPTPANAAVSHTAPAPASAPAAAEPVMHPAAAHAEAPARAMPARRWRIAARALAFGAAVVVFGMTVRHLGAGRDTAAPSIAVLPFVDLSEGRANEYLSDGITEELIATLGRIEGLHVTSRTSSFAFKDRQVDVRQIGEQLDVSVVLEGSLRRTDDDLHITARLVDARTGFNIWTRTYDRPARELFTVQDDLTMAVRSVLLPVARDTEVASAERATRDAEAYDLYLRGRYLLRDRTHARTLRAIDCFEQAIARDSSYARAHAGLADALINLAEFQPAGGVLPRARAAALRAIELDESLADAHVSLADIRLIHDRDWQAAEREYKRAIALDGESPSARRRYAAFLAAARRFDEHLHQTQLALALERAAAADPVAFAVREHATLASAYFAARRYEAAVEHGQKALELDPESWMARATLGRTYAELGRYDDAIAQLEEAWRKSGRLPALTRLGYAYARAGRMAEARDVLATLLARAESTYVPKDQIALLHLGLGDRERALLALRQAYEEQHWWLPWVNQIPAFDALRGDPEFRQLLRDLGVR